MTADKKNTPTRGTSIQMPSVMLDLGRYVAIRPRADGTYRVLFEVPKRLRPSGWSAAIPLPLDAPRNGDLSDAGEVARIQADARELYERLTTARSNAERRFEPPPRHDMPTLIRSWQSTQRFKAKKPRTQKGYAYHAGLIEAWSAARSHPMVSGLKLDKIEAFLAIYDDRPTTRRHLKIVLGMLLDHAVALEWIDRNPVDTIRMPAPKSRVQIWEASDLDFYMFAAAVAGQPGLAALMLTEWEIGQRLTDARLFRGTRDWRAGTKAAEYDFKGRAFRFWQSKTDSYVTIPVSDRLAAMLTATWDEGSLYLFRDAATGKPFAEARLSHEFERIRDLAKAAAPDLARHLVIRALRYSCVVQMARADCTIPQIASITGHNPFAAEQILAKYLPRDNDVAWTAQRKRGLIQDAKKNTA